MTKAAQEYLSQVEIRGEGRGVDGRGEQAEMQGQLRFRAQESRLKEFTELTKSEEYRQYTTAI